MSEHYRTLVLPTPNRGFFVEGDNNASQSDNNRRNNNKKKNNNALQFTTDAAAGSPQRHCEHLLIAVTAFRTVVFEQCHIAAVRVFRSCCKKCCFFSVLCSPIQQNEHCKTWSDLRQWFGAVDEVEHKQEMANVVANVAAYVCGVSVLADSERTPFEANLCHRVKAELLGGSSDASCLWRSVFGGAPQYVRGMNAVLHADAAQIAENIVFVWLRALPALAGDLAARLVPSSLRALLVDAACGRFWRHVSSLFVQILLTGTLRVRVGDSGTVSLRDRLEVLALDVEPGHLQRFAVRVVAITKLPDTPAKAKKKRTVTEGGVDDDFVLDEDDVDAFAGSFVDIDSLYAEAEGIEYTDIELHIDIAHAASTSASQRQTKKARRAATIVNGKRLF